MIKVTHRFQIKFCNKKKQFGIKKKKPVDNLKLTIIVVIESKRGCYSVFWLAVNFKSSNSLNTHPSCLMFKYVLLGIYLRVTFFN